MVRFKIAQRTHSHNIIKQCCSEVGKGRIFLEILRLIIEHLWPGEGWPGKDFRNIPYKKLKTHTVLKNP